ncbi:MAG TPA: diguanylate cyclase [Phycisphaerales bacterium]|nr:diguanylate cyclase [Phycisphaerales bacterium]
MTQDRLSIQTDGKDSQTAARTYCVLPTPQPIAVDADFEKPVWQATAPLEIACVQPATGSHRPLTQVKVRYDQDAVYMIFRVEDQWVRAVATDTHGAVWKDSCVEFFFTPQAEPSEAYFNLEVNCIGTVLMRYQTAPQRDIRFLEKDDCRQIKLAASLARRLMACEIETPVVWTVEYALPVALLRRYAPVEQPRTGAVWRGNFYKCADASSRPHWLSWSPISTASPDFHRPDGFGTLEFK